ncbi:MAG: hypothetical protein KUL88_10135 [Rhizobium sp.]|nr:hypothetical protein [Rhizobium sp.]
MNAGAETVRSELLVKRARMARVIELFRVQHLSTDAIAEVLGISEEQVCALLDEAERGGW